MESIYFRNLKPNKILDIGCNMGQFYQRCKIIFDNNFNIYLIDGNKNLEENIKKLNQPYNIVVLSDELKIVTWYSIKENSKSIENSYYEKSITDYSNEKLIQTLVQTNTLDNLFINECFDLIKIDTQGSELDIIKGGLNLCKKSKYIILKISIIEHNLNSPYEDNVNSFMKNIGFSIVDIIDSHGLNGYVIQRNILYKNLIKNNTLNFGETIVKKKNIDFIINKIVELGNISLNIAEVGVYKGGSAKIIYDVMNKNSNLFLFDTFNGMPYKSDSDNWHNIGDFYDTSYEEVCKLFSEKNVQIFKGIFPEETGKYISNIKFDLVHLDVDQYLSHKLALEFFYDKMVEGGYIIFDDYNSDYCKGATIAVNEFFQNKGEKILMDNNCYYIQRHV